MGSLSRCEIWGPDPVPADKKAGLKTNPSKPDRSNLKHTEDLSGFRRLENDSQWGYTILNGRCVARWLRCARKREKAQELAEFEKWISLWDLGPC